MFVTMEEVQEYVASALTQFGVTRLAAGTVVTSPGAVASDQLTVVMEPSALAVPVKSLRGQVLPGERVVLALVGADPRRSEWVCLGPLSEPATASSESVNGPATTSGSDTTTSASYVNMAGTGAVTSFSFTKRFAATRIKVTINASLYTTGAGADAMYGVRIGTTDYDLRLANGVLNQHQDYGALRHITGVPAGVYTIQARWKRTSGTGTPTRDTNDWLSFGAEEVA